jgi:hypothetical protein
MDQVIILFVSGALVGILSSYITYRFSECRDKKKEFQYAAAKFRAAFKYELMSLGKQPYPVLPDRPREIILREFLTNAFPKHYEAFLVFKVFLSPNIKPIFEKAWMDYCYPDGETNERPLNAYGNTVVSNEMGEYTIDEKIAIKRIERLIDFAKHN